MNQTDKKIFPQILPQKKLIQKNKKPRQRHWIYFKSSATSSWAFKMYEKKKTGTQNTVCKNSTTTPSRSIEQKT